MRPGDPVKADGRKPSPMGRFVIALAAALVVSGLGMFAPTSAVADDFGTCSSTTGCRADDANMDYCTPYAWDPTVWGAPFVAAMMNLDSQTDMYKTKIDNLDL